MYSLTCLRERDLRFLLRSGLNNFSEHQNYLEALLKHKLLGTTPEFLIQ